MLRFYNKFIKLLEGVSVRNNSQNPLFFVNNTCLFKFYKNKLITLKFLFLKIYINELNFIAKISSNNHHRNKFYSELIYNFIKCQ